jgi:Type II secretion system (T2SS), protein G
MSDTNIASCDVIPGQEVKQAVAPALWNVNATVNWCLIFTPLFSCILQAKNWKTLGESDKAKKTMIWAWVSIVVIIAQLFLPKGVVYAYLFIWYFANGRQQIHWVKKLYGNDYPKKSWGKPLGIATAIFVGYIIAIVSVVLISGKDDKPADATSQEAISTSGVNTEDADRNVARFLQSMTKAKNEQVTSLLIEAISTAIDSYEVDNGVFPGALKNLVRKGNENNWNGPYIPSGNIPKDAWGNAFEYTLKGEKFEIRSAGQDGELNTSDDIVNVDKKE